MVVAMLLAAAWTCLAATAGLAAGRADETRAGVEPGAPLPQRLSETGLFVTGSTTAVNPQNLAFSPQYPLWSDGATKRRWLHLPPGATIDASHPDAWEFPPGTRLWKEFGYTRPVETRFIERLADGSWRYATYVWNADGTDAVLAPADGVAAAPVRDAPDGRYAIPSQADCRACHEGAAVPVLGASALQLSPDRDPLAPHAEPARGEHVDLPGLVARGLLRNLPPALLERAPRIGAATPTGRAALGYLHANCGHCHNDAGPLAPLELALAQEAAAGPAGSAKALRTIIGQASGYRPRGADAGVQRIVPGRQDDSVLAMRMRTRDPLVQMPPLGSRIADAAGIALVERWIRNDLQPQKELAQ